MTNNTYEIKLYANNNNNLQYTVGYATTNNATTNECYNEQCYNERMLQRTVFSIKSGRYNEHRCYYERGGILSADVACACA